MPGIRDILARIRRSMRSNMPESNNRLFIPTLMLGNVAGTPSESETKNSVTNSGGETNKLNDQASLIRHKAFDTLIVLNSCRYDVFSEIVHKYLDGELKPVVSPSSTTVEWLKNVWQGHSWNDVVYVSALPLTGIHGFTHNKFLSIMEVHEWGWNDNLCTVPPYNVNLAVKTTLVKMKLKKLLYPKNYKLVIHYAQPHAPYPALKRIVKEIIDHIEDEALEKLNELTCEPSIEQRLLEVLKDILKNDEKIRETLYKAYKKNLEWVLKYVADLSTYLDGKIIITSDHGELLGENGLYFSLDIPSPILRTVPWFTIK